MTVCFIESGLLNLWQKVAGFMADACRIDGRELWSLIEETERQVLLFPCFRSFLLLCFGEVEHELPCRFRPGCVQPVASPSSRVFNQRVVALGVACQKLPYLTLHIVHIGLLKQRAAHVEHMFGQVFHAYSYIAGFGQNCQNMPFVTLVHRACVFRCGSVNSPAVSLFCQSDFMWPT